MPEHSEGPRREFAPTFIAHHFHDAYEELAPTVGYETRKESAVPWDEVPFANRRLMEKVVTRLIARKVLVAGPAWREHMKATEPKD